MGRAVSRYKQVSITLTEEQGGLVTIRVRVKPLNEHWSEKTLIHRAQYRLGHPLEGMDDVYALLLADLRRRPPSLFDE